MVVLVSRERERTQASAYLIGAGVVLHGILHGLLTVTFPLQLVYCMAISEI